MSFILDALKKSENERQQQAPADLSIVPSQSDVPAAPRWMWVLAALLAVNIVVIVGLVSRSDAPQVSASVSGDSPNTSTNPGSAAESAQQNFSEQVAAAREKQLPVIASNENAETPQSDSVTANPTPSPVQTSVAPPTVSPRANTAYLPSFTDLQARGALDIPELHIDLHAFNDSAPKRFVFINGAKYREKSRLDEGPVVEEITRDGVVLDHRGTRFLLARE